MSDSTDYQEIDVGLNVTSDYDYETIIKSVLWPNPVEQCFVVILATMMFIGIIGNILVVFVVATNKSMRNPLNLILMNLAVADLHILIICLPPTVINDVTKTFWFSTLFCKGVLFLQNTSVYVSIMSLVFITGERWRAITYPLKSPVVRTKTAIIAIWVIAMVFSIPEPLTLQLLPANFARPNFTTTWGTQCKETWSSTFQLRYQFAQVIFTYLLPLIVISVLCFHMMQTLHSSTNLAVASRQILSRRKAVRMLCCVVFLFALSNLPVHVYNIALACDILDPEENGDVEVDVNIIAIRKLLPRVFSFSSSCLNPILYSFLSGRFRDEFGRVVCCERADNSSREFRRKQASLYSSSQRHRNNSCSTMISTHAQETSLIMKRTIPLLKKTDSK